MLIPTSKSTYFFSTDFSESNSLDTFNLILGAIDLIFSASLPESEEETWEESQPWLRSQNEPHHQRQRHGWFWRKKPRTTPSITEQPPPATTTKPSGPKICRNRTIVTRVQDEPGPIVCLRKNITELMTQLKSVGGFIRRYTAIRVIDACGFQDLTPFKSSTPTRPPTMAGNSSKQLSNSKGKRQADQIQSDIELQRRKRSIPTSPGTLLRGCQGRGTIIDGTSEHRLCTECAATTRLPNDRFPRYINEVVCRDSDRHAVCC